MMRHFPHTVSLCGMLFSAYMTRPATNHTRKCKNTNHRVDQTSAGRRRPPPKCMNGNPQLLCILGRLTGLAKYIYDGGGQDKLFEEQLLTEKQHFTALYV